MRHLHRRTTPSLPRTFTRSCAASLIILATGCSSSLRNNSPFESSKTSNGAGTAPSSNIHTSSVPAVQDRQNTHSNPPSLLLTDARAGERWFTSGSLVLSRPAPRRSVASRPSLALGFSPRQDSAVSLEIDTGLGVGVLRSNNGIQSNVPMLSVSDLPPGKYTVVHKQHRPAWYAPDEYFVRRNLPVPPQGDATRYLRGALGERAIYLDDQRSLHASPIECDEVRGVRMKETEIARLFDSLPVGSTVLVR
jgi:hypothetical protein